MGMYEGLFSVFQYPVLSVIDLTKKVGQTVINISGLNTQYTPDMKLPPNLQNLDVSVLVKKDSTIFRIAAVSGALAVILGAYGAHILQHKEDSMEKTVYETANRYHFFHTLAMLCVPLSKYPKTAGSFMAAGIVMFSGACYYHAFTGKSDLKNVAPIGGISLMLGWLFMML